MDILSEEIGHVQASAADLGDQGPTKRTSRCRVGVGLDENVVGATVDLGAVVAICECKPIEGCRVRVCSEATDVEDAHSGILLAIDEFCCYRIKVE